MRIFLGAIWLIVFILLFGFALNNTDPAQLHFFAGAVWQAPLVAVLLVFFVAGVVFGFLAMLPIWFRQRLELRRLRRSQQEATPPPAGTTAVAAPESIQSVAQGARTTT